MTTTAFSPASIPGLQLWYDASDASTVTQSGGTVSQVNDKSGNGYNAVQGTGSLQPAYSLAARNGLNALTFNTDAQRLFTTPLVISGQFSMFCVGGVVSGKNFSPFGAFNNTGILLRYSGGDYYYQGSDAGLFTVVSPQDSTTGFFNFEYLRDASNIVSLLKDGVGSFTTTNFSENVDYGVLGASFTGAGGSVGFGSQGCTFCEVIIYTRYLNLTERAKVENYVRTKWGTP